ncbi:TPM domain-containing protein [Blattabacterium cuenoti]|uniref:TPM domain-containing protein n=1 Tax=Blattabacterium cuenoti TaxID=1653831 RepID=UPI001EEB5CC6|nr:TPM domain-containing protein [Blattabacterium cuenoti]
MKTIIKIVLFLFIISNFTIQAQNQIPNPPYKIYPIQDYAKILSEKERLLLNNKLISYYKKTSTEIIVIIIHNLHGEDPNIIANEWGQKWKIGKLYKNNGIVILISIDDKKISIQNGYGIEPYITDIITGNIIKKVNPYLKNRMYYQTINSIVNELSKFLKHHFKKKIMFQKIHGFLVYLS